MQYPLLKPAIVERALHLAAELGFAIRPDGNPPEGAGDASCCIDAVGSLLQTLCASLHSANVGEIGTGAGVGTAWLAAGLQDGSTLTSVEIDMRLHTAVAKLFLGDERIRLLNEDWRQTFVQQAPYDLLFADGGGIGATPSSGWEQVAELIHPHGMMVIDDLTPEALWPASWRGKPDPKRELAFNSGYFQSTEVRTGAETSALIMVRL